MARARGARTGEAGATRGTRALATLLACALLALAACGRGTPDVDGRGAGPAATPGAASAGARPRRPPSSRSLDVVLVTVGTLRADATGFGGSTRVKTPAFDRLAASGVVFTNARAHDVVTLPAHCNILTGLLPTQHGVRDDAGFRLSGSVPTLATRLKQRGYATGAFVAASPLDRRFGLAHGFDVYDDLSGRGSDPPFVVPRRPGTEVVSAALAWWNGQPAGKRFLWVHLFEPHAPYAPPPPFDAEYRDDPYLGAVAAADAALAPLVSAVLDSPPAPALVVFTSDHGESLGEHGERTHGLFAYDATLKVPLVVAAAGATSRVDDRLAGHVDIVPTVLAAIGLRPDPTLPGSPLLEPPPPGDRAHYFEALSARLDRGWAPLTGVVRGTLKFVSLPVPELYDLAADPHEKANLAPAREADVRDLARLIPPEAARPARRVGVTPGEIARLKALGYVASPVASEKESFTEADDPKRLVEVDRQLQELVELYARGPLARAVREAEGLVRRHPTMTAAVGDLAFLYQRADRLHDADRLLSAAAKRGVDTHALRVRHARVLVGMGRARDAVALLEPLASGGDPDVLSALGDARADAGDLAGAESALGQALAASPDDPRLLRDMGSLSLRAARYAEARDRFRRAVALSPGMPGIWNGLGSAELKLGDVGAALDAWARGVKADPRDYDALFNLATTSARNGRMADAAPLLRRFVSEAPPRRYHREIAEARSLLAGKG